MLKINKWKQNLTKMELGGQKWELSHPAAHDQRPQQEETPRISVLTEEAYTFLPQQEEDFFFDRQ